MVAVATAPTTAAAMAATTTDLTLVRQPRGGDDD
jgi:formate dehydrogenase assembly factor FdhD